MVVAEEIRAEGAIKVLAVRYAKAGSEVVCDAEGGEGNASAYITDGSVRSWPGSTALSGCGSVNGKYAAAESIEAEAKGCCWLADACAAAADAYSDKPTLLALVLSALAA